MGVKFGDIDITKQILDSEFRIIVLEKTIEFLVNRNISITPPTVDDLDRFRKEAAKILKNKYPNSVTLAEEKK
jgi:hypothetical protein